MDIPEDTQSDQDRDLHALNIHGDFFESLCRKTIEESPGWDIIYANYPVDYPPPSTGFLTKQSELDIYASHSADECRLSLLVECKKANPEFVSWTFFPVHAAPKPELLILPRITYRDVRGNDLTGRFGPDRTTLSVEAAHRGRETRGNYRDIKQRGDRTKTTTAAISDAALQVAIATQAIVTEEVNLLQAERHGQVSRQGLRQQVFLPMIVTTAKLSLCRFEPGDIDPATGEIPEGKADLEQVDRLFFEFPLPTALQSIHVNRDELRANRRLEKEVMRLRILVVNSLALPATLTWVRQQMSELVDA